MEKIKIKDKNGETGWVLQFVFNNSRGVLAVICRKDGRIDTLPISEIVVVLKADK